MAHISRLPSGNWRALVRRKGHKSKSQTFTLKRDALQWAMAIESQAEHIAAYGKQPVPEGYTVAKLVDTYIERTPPGQKTKTATLQMLRNSLGNILLAKLGASHLRDFIIQRMKTAGGVTIAGDLSILGSVLRFARDALLLDVPENLALDARRQLAGFKLNTRSTERDREPTQSELDRLYAHWDNNPRQIIPMTTICRFAIATAMRQDEICSILIEDISGYPQKPTVIIRDRKDPRKKIGNNQRVPLLPDAWCIVAPIMESRTEGRLFPFNSASVSTAFTRACLALDIEDLHFHDLRHYATGKLFRMGLDIPTVSVLTGHKDWKMLKRYTHTTAEDVFAKLTTNDTQARV
ncbi:tyrosine-type recombinase/integrase [Herbaspirillum aquaticum]|uniref:Integrase n=1 Tax=Herbaspirillum aquaticum TaxID=568783 RepID=A0A225SL58_9BURK|nr:site-specific integrase [Herbaspirillum aquaticum]OWY31688.1 integrase [Herbaspirillum aquaticum]